MVEVETLEKDKNKSKSRSRLKSKGTRNELLNNSKRFLKFNATLWTRSQADHTKRAVKRGGLPRPEVPNLLCRGAEKFMGKS